MSNRVLIIGAGGVGRVVTHKCAQAPGTFGAVCLASRSREKCETIAQSLNVPIRTAQVDAESTPEVVRLIRDFEPVLVVHVALPYQNLAIMEACLETGVHYLDTANYESRELAHFEYRQQWDYHERYRRRGITALLGSGFDPGVTNVFCAWARKELFDRIDQIDILDCNDGDHGLPFATNFNVEINLREITAPGRWWEQGQWHTCDPLSRELTFEFPGIGPRKAYLTYHEELESLSRHFPEVQRLRFWMTFSDSYRNALDVLQNVGLTRIDPVDYEGRPVVPVQFLKSLLPDPVAVSERYQGKTSIGCLIVGEAKGRQKRVFIHTPCDHQASFREVGMNAVAYTAGVPAATGAKMILDGKWSSPGVFNLEELDPDPFLAALPEFGLPWKVQETASDASAERTSQPAAGKE